MHFASKYANSFKILFVEALQGANRGANETTSSENVFANEQ
jgi:hypothetical protein